METDAKNVNRESLRIVITVPFRYAVVMQISILVTYISVNSKSLDKFIKKSSILRGYDMEGFYHFQ